MIHIKIILDKLLKEIKEDKEKQDEKVKVLLPNINLKQ